MNNEYEYKQFCSYLIYPFRHSLNNKNINKKAEVISSLWESWIHRIEENDLEQVIDDTHFFLPYVREILFPQLSTRKKTLPNSISSPLKMAKEIANLYKNNKVTRVTLKKEILKQFNNSTLVYEHQKISVPFTTDWVDLFIFPQRVGILVLKVHPNAIIEQEDESKENILTKKNIEDFLKHISFIHPPTLSFRLAKWEIAIEEKKSLYYTREITDYLVQGLWDKRNIVETSLTKYTEKVRGKSRTLRYSESYYGQSYSENFGILSYGLPSKENNQEQTTDEENANNTTKPLKQIFGYDIFAKRSNRLLYEITTKTNMIDEQYMPHYEYAQEIFKKNHIAIWDSWEALALDNNVYFQAKPNVRFNEVNLPRNIENDYLMLFVSPS